MLWGSRKGRRERSIWDLRRWTCSCAARTLLGCVKSAAVLMVLWRHGFAPSTVGPFRTRTMRVWLARVRGAGAVALGWDNLLLGSGGGRQRKGMDDGPIGVHRLSLCCDPSCNTGMSASCSFPFFCLSACL
ncbi:T. brucei spp.-specific protein [Trypanosoma brucei gambiense DAL972]|uniref:Uncharacterized protein n=3 Tax=Trypanosoma brucei TaxID=5691 RepID=Q388J4_TRYB2|nr:T. brucei spp.-specific protein [Trypanosoma brucei gambiense DAL972]XP_827888.1 hypothetical protein Tb10.61.2830 [Trypanosoma brucei brucei TREU927]RHW69572.1 hypothetical protein DPX39_100146600 [Trypanosoma brucei equiperdum]EAN78776.1 hypothetical protein Tb10.61.2830 [Trypanosoma brucei brucei TREU927]RHW69830.1 hypothetical protein DPX39_100147600 [Trypanosoma brucei equiperdum]CBH16622.1 T. brucei spp.-specific protein [Trypanosoma brucei gambiense DAL972]|eukprot:XP_011778886.1 T. brucei spp.-specific protein [Trypanosoma brucei gambiense DAL972]